MNYDAMTREQAIELLRLAMDTLQSLDSGLASEQRDAVRALQNEAMYVGIVAEPTPAPVTLDGGWSAHSRIVDRLGFIAANDQARRALRSVDYRLLHRARELDVLYKEPTP